jgi:acetyl-CoA carboxylase beta subunit
MNAEKIIEAILSGQDHWVLCPQCKYVVEKRDLDPQAGMCGACINEAMAEMPEYLGVRGLVATAEEQQSHD